MPLLCNAAVGQTDECPDSMNSHLGTHITSTSLSPIAPDVHHATIMPLLPFARAATVMQAYASAGSTLAPSASIAIDDASLGRAAEAGFRRPAHCSIMQRRIYHIGAQTSEMRPLFDMHAPLDASPTTAHISISLDLPAHAHQVHLYPLR
ncbi:hypothetical protein B0H10DRAFT_2429806 [Mycena sp. CBHHK59/15]|nr:hypothetical protein B0H10DRAFT_2429806 [Mycena sp. CBHHK59/15]